MTDLRCPIRVPCKMNDLLCNMTNRTLKMNSLQHLTFDVVFNKTLRGDDGSGANEAEQVYQPVPA